MKISILSLFRDSENHLPETLASLEALENQFENYRFEYFFYENDSTDNTVKILSEWLRSRKGHLTAEDLGKAKFSSTTHTERMTDLVYYRNTLLESAIPLSSDYCVLLDSDVAFDPSILSSYIEIFDDPEFSDVVMITPNVLQNIKCKMFDPTQDSYYDSWALRDRFDNRGMTWTCNPFFNLQDRIRWVNKQPVYVNSAFGGCPIIKSDVLNQVQWSTDGGCEHWNFCRDVRVHGDIVVAPDVEVSVEIDEAIINSIGESHMNSVVTQQRQTFELLKNF